MRGLRAYVFSAEESEVSGLWGFHGFRAYRPCEVDPNPTWRPCDLVVRVINRVTIVIITYNPT